MRNYTIDEATKIVGLGRTKLYGEINAGRLKAVKVGARTLIPEASIAEWQANLPLYPIKNNAGYHHVA